MLVTIASVLIPACHSCRCWKVQEGLPKDSTWTVCLHWLAFSNSCSTSAFSNQIFAFSLKEITSSRRTYLLMIGNAWMFCHAWQKTKCPTSKCSFLPLYELYSSIEHRKTEAQRNRIQVCGFTMFCCSRITKLKMISLYLGVQKRDPSYTVGGNVSWYSHYGKQYGGTLKSKNRTTIWSCSPTPGHIYGESHNSKNYMHPCVHCSAVYNSQDMEAM